MATTELNPPQFTGFAVLRDVGAEVFHLDWESVSETIEEAVRHAITWHDGEGVIVKVTATVEPVATMVECEQPESEKVVSGLLF